MTPVLPCVLVLVMAVFAVSAVPFAHAQTPTLTGASLDEATGVLVVGFSEDIDQDPISDVNATRFAITESDGTSPVPLTNATVSSINGTAISFTLDLHQLADVRMLATPTLDIGAGAAQDADGNPIAASSGNMIHITATSGLHNPSHVSSLNATRDNLLLEKARDIAITEIGSKTYAVVTADFPTNAVSIIDITNASDPLPVSNVTDGEGGFEYLSGANGVAVAEIGSKVYAVVTAVWDAGVQIMDITDPSNPTAVATVDGGSDLDFGEIGGVAIVEIGSNVYALLAVTGGNHLTIIDITDPTSPSRVSTIKKLENPADVAVAEINSKTYAVTTGTIGSGLISILDVTDPSNPLKVSNVTGGQGDVPNLQFGAGVEIVQIGSKTYAVSVAGTNGAFLILDISDPADPLYVFSARDGRDGFNHIGRANDVAVAEIGSSIYALVTALDNAVTIIDITHPSDSLLVSVARDNRGGLELALPNGIGIVEIDSVPYALVTTKGDHGLQIMDISDYAPPAVSYGLFNPVTGVLSVTFDEPVDPDSINASKFAIAGGDSPVRLDGATPATVDANTVSLTLNTTQRESLESVLLPTLDVEVRAIQDVSNNPIAASQGTLLYVSFESASIDEARGVLTLQFDRPLDSNLTKADPTKFTITESDGTLPIPLTGAASSVNDTAISFTLNATQATNVRMLATPTLDIAAGAVQDAGGYKIVASSGNMIHVSVMAGTYNPVPISSLTTPGTSIETSEGEAAIAQIGSKTYAVVAAQNTDGIRIIDITDPASPNVVSTATDGAGNFTGLKGATGVAITQIDSRTYALIASVLDNAVQIIDITNASGPVAVSLERDGQGGFQRLENADIIVVTEIDSVPYALVSATNAQGNVQIMNIADPTNATAVSHLSLDTSDPVYYDNPGDIAIAQIGSETYAVVPIPDLHRVAIINITDPTDQTIVLRLNDGRGGFEALRGANGVAITQIDSKTYAVVASKTDNAVQIIDITNASAPTPVSHAIHNQGGFDRLNGARDVAITQIGSKVYALVTAGGGVQVMDITDPQTPLPVSSVRDGQGGFEKLGGAYRTSIAKIGSGTYAVVTSTVAHDKGLQIIDISDYTPPVLSAASLDYDTDVLSLTFNEPVDPDSIDPSRLAVNGGDSPVSLAGATATTINATTISLALTGSQAASVHTVPLPVLDVGVRAIQDVSQNPVAASQDNRMTLSGTPNIEPVPPSLVEASLDESSGSLTLTFDRPIDQDPISDVDVSKFTITDASDASPVALTGAAVETVNDRTIAITLTSAQLASVKAHATPDLDIEAGAVRDLEGNQIVSSSDHPVTVGDTTPPTLAGAALDQSTGILTLDFGEAIDSSDVNTSGLTIRSGDNSAVPNDARIIPANATGIHVILTDSQAASVKAYNVTPFLLDIAAGTVRDLAENPIAESANNTITPVDNPPILLSATLDEKTITLTFSERIDTDPISDVNPSWLTVTDSGNDSPVQLTGAMVWPVGNETVRIIPVQSQMDQIALHEKPDLDILDGAVRDMKQQGIIASDDNTIVRADDAVPPKLAAASMDNRMGILTVTFDEPINTDHTMIDTAALVITARDGEDVTTTSLESSAIVPEDLNAIRIILNSTQLESLQSHDTLTLDITRAGAVTDLAGMELAAHSGSLTVIPEEPLGPTFLDLLTDSDSFDFLSPNGLTITEIDSHMYALVALQDSNGVRIINVSDPETLEPVAFVRDGIGGFAELQSPRNIATAKIGSETYAVVTASSRSSSGVQIMNITDPANPVAASHMSHGADGFLALEGPRGVAVAQIGSDTYAVVPALISDAVSIINITDPESPSLASNVTDGFAKLDGALGVAITQINSQTYAVVAAKDSNAVSILDITDPANPSLASNVTAADFAKLNGAAEVAITQIDSKTYVVVTAYRSDAVSMLDITDPENPLYVFGIRDGEDGFTQFGGVNGVAITQINSKTYALVASHFDRGVQLMDITDPQTPLPAAHITEGERGFDNLFNSQDVGIVKIGSSTYVLVTVFDDFYLQIANITNLESPVPVSATLDEKTQTIRLAFDDALGRTQSSYVDLSKVMITDGTADGASSITLDDVPMMPSMPYNAGMASIPVTPAHSETASYYIEPHLSIGSQAVDGLILPQDKPITMNLTIFDSSLCGVSLEHDRLDLSEWFDPGDDAKPIPQFINNTYSVDIAAVRADVSHWNADGIRQVSANATEVKVDNGQYWYPMESVMLITANLEPGEPEPLSFRFNLPENTTMSGSEITQTIKYMATCG